MGLVRYWMSRLGWEGSEEDALQAGAVALLEAERLWQPERAKFSTFASIKIRRALENEMRATSWCGQHPADWELLESRHSSSSISKVEKEELIEAVRQLLEPQRDVIIQRYFHGVRPVDIARQKGVRRVDIWYLEFQGIRQLRKMLGFGKGK